MYYLTTIHGITDRWTTLWLCWRNRRRPSRHC